MHHDLALLLGVLLIGAACLPMACAALPLTRKPRPPRPRLPVPLMLTAADMRCINAISCRFAADLACNDGGDGRSTIADPEFPAPSEDAGEQASTSQPEVGEG